MKEKILIGLLCNNLKPIPFYKLNKNSTLQDNQDSPIQLIKFIAKGIDWKKGVIKGIALKNGEWEKTTTDFPAAVYSRCYTSSTAVTSKLEDIIGKGKVFNSFTQFDKYTIFSILKENGLNDLMIPTYLYDSSLLINRLNQGESLLIKPTKGSMGNNIYRLTFEGNAYKLYSQTHYPIRSFILANELLDFISQNADLNSYIIQPFISFSSIDGRIFDMRMLVQKNYDGHWDVTADMSRISHRNYFVTNTAYAVCPAWEVLKNMPFEKDLLQKSKEISIQVAKILDHNLCTLGEISVDFGIGIDGKLWIIEVNGKPEKTIFGRISEETLDRVFHRPLEYATYLSKNN